MCTPRGADPCPYTSHPRGAHLHPKQGCTVCTPTWGAYMHPMGCLFVPLGVLICTLRGAYLYHMGYLFVPYGVHICNVQGAYMHPQGYRPLSLYEPPQGFTSAPYIGVHTRTLWGAYLYPLGCLYAPPRGADPCPYTSHPRVQICTLNKGAHMHL